MSCHICWANASVIIGCNTIEAGRSFCTRVQFFTRFDHLAGTIHPFPSTVTDTSIIVVLRIFKAHSLLTRVGVAVSSNFSCTILSSIIFQTQAVVTTGGQTQTCGIFMARVLITTPSRGRLGGTFRARLAGGTGRIAAA